LVSAAPEQPLIALGMWRWTGSNYGWPWWARCWGAGVRREAGNQTGQESRSAARSAAPSVTGMAITIDEDRR
jgi:hypothetical protein